MFIREVNEMISLELQNLPSTSIISLVHVHGFVITNSPSKNYQVLDQEVDYDDESKHDGIKLFDFHSPYSVPKQIRTTPSKLSTVQCWLYDGPHKFHQCTDLVRMKSACIKHPSILQHFQQLLLNKNG